MPIIKVIPISRKDFVGNYLGETEVKASKFLERNKGNVLLFEKNNNICRNSSDILGLTALDSIISFLICNPGSIKFEVEAGEYIHSKIEKIMWLSSYRLM